MSAEGIFPSRGAAREYVAARVALPDDSPERVEALTDDVLAGPRDPEARARVFEAAARREAAQVGPDAPAPAGCSPESGDEPLPGPRDLEALVEPLREVLARGQHTPMSIAPELAALAERLRLAAVTPVERRAIQEAVKKLLIAAGVGGAHDLAREALRPPDRPTRIGGETRGRALELEDPEPWPESVEGSRLLDEIVATLNQYIVLPRGAAVAIALWVAHTYLMDVWSVTPLLAPSSPTKRCGKTTLLRIIGKLVRRALAASGVSAAAIFRMVEEHEPCLLIDEMDSMKENEDLRGVLNSGHTRDLAFIIRCVGEGGNIEPRRFSTWCPKLLAHIGRLPSTLEDRAIQIQMRRKLPGERRQRIRRRELEAQLLPIRRKLARWAEDIRDVLAVHQPLMPDELDDRALDNWEPLVSIADATGGNWPQLARSAAVALSSDRVDDEADDNPGLLLLTDLAALLESRGLDAEDGIAADAACTELRKLEERPWRAWGKGNDGLQPVHLARLLRPFRIKSKQIRLGTQVVRRYPADLLREAMARYGCSGSGKPTTPATGPNPVHVSADGSTGVAGVAGVAGREGCSGYVREPGEDDDDPTPTAAAEAAKVRL